MSLNSHRENKLSKLIIIDSIIEIYYSLDKGEDFFEEPPKRMNRKKLKRMSQKDLNLHLEKMNKSIDNRVLLWYNIYIVNKGGWKHEKNDKTWWN